MQKPVAVKLNDAQMADVYRVKIDPEQARLLKPVHSSMNPAVVVTGAAALLPDIAAVVIDGDGIVAVQEGNWQDAILVVMSNAVEMEVSASDDPVKGDGAFLARVERDAPHLLNLATKSVAAIRAAGVDGDLVEAKGGLWVNRPINTFTLKVQPRVGNIKFTLYGNPDTYQAGEFLLRDQNSYSRGWIRGLEDVATLAALARQSHSRRK